MHLLHLWNFDRVFDDKTQSWTFGELGICLLGQFNLSAPLEVSALSTFWCSGQKHRCFLYQTRSCKRTGFVCESDGSNQTIITMKFNFDSRDVSKKALLGNSKPSIFWGKESNKFATENFRTGLKILNEILVEEIEPVATTEGEFAY